MNIIETSFLKFIIGKDEINIPKRVADLLWISEKEPDISDLTNAFIITAGINLDTRSVKVESSKSSEPSVIYTKMPIKKPRHIDQVPNPSYYPRYASLSPEQKWVYLNWLQDVTKPIYIGYLFIYYYGLERHLVLGDAEAALEEIFLLRANHSQGSFLGYSRIGVIAACLFRDKHELLVKYEPMLQIKGMDNIGLHLCSYLGKSITADNIIGMANEVCFAYKSYISRHYELFKEALKKILVNKYGKEAFSLNKYDKDVMQKSSELMFANQSFPDEIKHVVVPNYFKHKPFVDEINELLALAHQETKNSMAQKRKRKIN